MPVRAPDIHANIQNAQNGVGERVVRLRGRSQYVRRATLRMGLLNPKAFENYEPANMFEKAAKNLFEQATKKNSASASVAWRAIHASLGEDKITPGSGRGGTSYRTDAEKRGPEVNPIPTPDDEVSLGEVLAAAPPEE